MRLFRRIAKVYVAPMMEEHRTILKRLEDDVRTIRSLLESETTKIFKHLEETTQSIQKITSKIYNLQENLESIQHDVKTLEAELQKLKTEIAVVFSNITSHGGTPSISKEISHTRLDSPNQENDFLREKAPKLSSKHNDERPHQVKHGTSTETKMKKKVIPPEKRGGRPRVGYLENQDFTVRSAKSTYVTRKTKSPSLRSEPVCIRRGRVWQVYLNLPDDVLSKPSLEVWQGGSRLFKEAYGWPLVCLDKDVEVKWDEDGAQKVHKAFEALQANDALLFKLDHALERGRQVKRVSKGAYLTIVPETWELATGIPNDPEPTQFPGYKAYYLDTTRTKRLVFSAEGRTFVPWKQIEFVLVGQIIADYDKEIGPLFRYPPCVKAPTDVWKEINLVVIGEEGPGKNKWRTSFKPNPEDGVQSLPPELSARGGGWYFLRFYNQNDELVDSMDFRFMSALKEIRILPQREVILPGPSGHEVVHVEFRHEEGCEVSPIGDLSGVKIKREPTCTVVEIPPDPSLDRTQWRIETFHGGTAVEIKLGIKLPRVWWALIDGSSRPSSIPWTDRDLYFGRNNFAASSNYILLIKSPLKTILAGFAGDPRHFSAQKEDDFIEIPLCEFTDVALLNEAGEHDFYGKIARNPFRIGKVVIRLKCRWCKFKSFQEEVMLEHILEKHWDKVYEQCYSSENHKTFGPIVKTLWKCAYCEYTDRDPYKVANHQDKKHPGKERRVLPKEFHLQKCKLCGEQFDLSRVGREELRKHLQQAHWSQLCELE